MSKKIIVIFLIALLLIPLLSTPSYVFANNPHEIINDGVNTKIEEYKDQIAFIANLMIVFSAVVSVLIFVIHFVKLGGYHSHSMMRKKVIQDLMVSAGCTALIGGFGLIFRIYLGVFVQ